MGDVQFWIPTTPARSGAITLAAVLALSVLSPPWVGRIRRSAGDPSLVDRCKLFRFLHPSSAALLRLTGAVALGAAVCIAVLDFAQRHDTIARAQRAFTALHRV